ncbi:TPA_exp: Uncharacterized protein A8136_2224 [Trichophyton benhamiae CBS 112371]|uniref:Uncharacterized protein n=1 Tax=Arthroderma benhamiae (strain ATCC MYA-4681 / CBS 112371) TaxID=663331 RepID=D4AYK2_ARTBC|nr:uncharacterized protein ARB_01271 [Trichophyton benhamiae CBS 112371]EFE31672.1 hypothetical protein ARB_01271 [Trichophyton benhamiae CBS 112371]DAA74806.1 TPA_exp: Uncharacterized protein A8136_2224 [Trichophyton benhamiae CBS 112371]
MTLPPQSVDNFLRQLQLGFEKCHPRDSEAEAALSCLPKDTPVFKYESASQMETAARSVDNGSGGYCVFYNVVDGLILLNTKQKRIRKREYFPISRLLVAKMLSEPHEVATEWLHDELVVKISSMGMRFHAYLVSIGSTTIEHKEPDYSARPRNLPLGRTRKWPTLVVETGKSQSHSDLDRVARRWIQKSAGDVKIVLTIQVSRTELTIRRYGRSGITRATIPQTITIEKRGQNSPIHIVGNPLIIPFADLFLRTAIRNQGDIIFNNTELEELAKLVWESF